MENVTDEMEAEFHAPDSETGKHRGFPSSEPGGPRGYSAVLLDSEEGIFAAVAASGNSNITRSVILNFLDPLVSGKAKSRKLIAANLQLLRASSKSTSQSFVVAASGFSVPIHGCNQSKHQHED